MTTRFRSFAPFLLLVLSLALTLAGCGDDEEAPDDVATADLAQDATAADVPKGDIPTDTPAPLDVAADLDTQHAPDLTDTAPADGSEVAETVEDTKVEAMEVTDTADLADAAEVVPVVDKLVVPKYALSVHISKSNMDSQNQELELEQALGISLIRTDFHWKYIEPEQDVFAFDQFDTLVDNVIAHDLEMIGLFAYGADWAKDDDLTDSSISSEDYYDFVFETVTHFVGRIDKWEVWNEENIDRFWKPAPDADGYGRLLKAAYQATKDACPDCKVCIGGLAATDILYGKHWIYMDQLYAAHPDIGDYYDALAIHPYTSIQQLAPEVDDFIVGSFAHEIQTAWDILAEHGETDKELWITEMGWPACPCPPEEPPEFPIPNVTYEEQAQWLVRAFAIAAMKDVSIVTWYDFSDGSGNSDPSSEAYFGIVQYDPDPSTEPGPALKPSYTAMQTYVAQVGDKAFVEDRSQVFPAELEGYYYVFGEEGSTVSLIWLAKEGATTQATITNPDPTATWELVDMYGASLGDPVVDGTLQMVVSNSPVYLVEHH